MSGSFVFNPQFFVIDDDFFKPRVPCIDTGTHATAFCDRGIIFGNVKLVGCSPCGNKPALEAGAYTHHGAIGLYWNFPIVSATLYFCPNSKVGLPKQAVIECFRGGTKVFETNIVPGCMKIQPDLPFDTIRILSYWAVYLEGVSYEVSLK